VHLPSLQKSTAIDTCGTRLRASIVRGAKRWNQSTIYLSRFGKATFIPLTLSPIEPAIKNASACWTDWNANWSHG